MKIINIITSKYFAFLCFLCGIIYFVLLSQIELSQRTYMSENALLVGLIKQQFSNVSAINHFNRMYSNILKKDDNSKTVNWLKETMEDIGLDTGIQNFTFQYDKLLNDQKFDGQNVFGILRSPGAARMQSILITVPLRYGNVSSKDSQPLMASVACVLALAQHCRGKLYWAMDIIFLFTDMEYVGMQAWLNGYHGLQHPRDYIVAGDLFPRSGSILASFNVEIASQNIAYLEFRLESLNGQLPNLDLYNTFVRLATDLDIPVRIHGVPPATSDSATSRLRSLRSMLSMMQQQSSGSPSGLHGLLASHQIPALTVHAVTSSSDSTKTNLFAVSRLLESALRCLNSLQERLHQSFFFYLLPGSLRYVSIGMYMPAAGATLCLPLLLPAVGALLSLQETSDQDWRLLARVAGGALGAALLAAWALDHCLVVCHRLNTAPDVALLAGAAIVTLAVMVVSRTTGHRKTANADAVVLVQTAARLGLGLFLGALSVLNVSLAVLLGLAIVPAAIFVRPHRHWLPRTLTRLYLILVSPLALLYVCALLEGPVRPWSDPQRYLEAIAGTRRALVHAWAEKDLLGSWTVDIVTLGYLPFWIVHWSLAAMETTV